MRLVDDDDVLATAVAPQSQFAGEVPSSRKPVNSRSDNDVADRAWQRVSRHQCEAVGVQPSSTGGFQWVPTWFGSSTQGP